MPDFPASNDPPLAGPPWGPPCLEGAPGLGTFSVSAHPKQIFKKPLLTLRDDCVSYPLAPSYAEVLPEVECSGVVGSPQPVCAACGGPRGPRKQAACSDGCRAALSRRRRASAMEAWHRAIEELLETALRRLRDG